MSVLERNDSVQKSKITPEQQNLLPRGQAGRLPANWRTLFPEILGESKAVLSALETVAKVATADGSVLIFGESGTGKELVASAIHRVSSRRSNRFIAINCSAIPEALLEAELFGHEKGAFTGADKKRVGLFEVANKGSIFLDEIGDMPLNLQSKLLRVLQEKQYSPIGSNEVKSVDVRVIAATHVDLTTAISEKRFRADLFYRLNVLPIELPPLRERLDDIAILTENFLKEANRLNKFNEASYFTNRVYHLMRQHNWPGNVRELYNFVERMVVIKGGGAIQPDHLPKDIFSNKKRWGSLELPESQAKNFVQSLPGGSQSESLSESKGTEALSALPEEGMDLCQYILDLENRLILEALARTNNNKNQAAKLLGLNRTTLVERIKKRKLAHIHPPTNEL